MSLAVSRRANLAFLMASFAVGQGSMFIANSWLLAVGKLDLLADFGSCYAFAILFLFLCDAGGTVMLARSLSSDVDPTAVSKQLSALIMIRIVIAVLTTSVALIGAIIAKDAFSIAYFSFSSIGLLVWSLNLMGVLDGHRLSGVSGLTYALPPMCTAAATFASASLEPVLSGLLLGAAFSLGAGAAVTVQHAVCAHLLKRPALVRVDPTQFLATLNSSLKLLAGTLPGQLFYRVQLITVGFAFDKDTLGAFVYAKQLINATAQVLVFSLRTGFPDLVQRTNSLNRLSAVSALSISWRSVLVVVVGTASIWVSWLVAGHLPGDLHVALSISVAMTPILVTAGSSLIISNAVVAAGRYGSAGIAANTGLAVGIVLTLLLTPALGLSGLIAAECIANALTFFVNAYFLNHRTTQN